MPGQYNPETILQEQFESQRQQIQQQFRSQWDEVNRQAREGLFKSPKEHEEILHKLYAESKQTMLEFDQKAEQGMGQLKQIDKLVEAGAIKDPDETKWRLVLGPEAEKAMFQQPADPRLEHQRNLAAQNRALDTVAAYIIDNGKLYHAKTKKVGNSLQLTDKADTNKPATQGEVQLWSMSKDAVSALEQEELGILGQLSDAGTPDPVYLQSLLVKDRRESWFKRFAAGTSGQYAFGGGISRKKTFGPEPTGTFAQKVQEDVVKPQPRVQQPSTGKKLTREIAMRYLMSHPDRQEAMAAARLDGYTE